MIIKNLKLKNYGAINDADIDFQKGFNIISGANGQGKSHIIRSIAYLILNYNKGKIEDDCNWNSESFNIKLDLEHNNKNFLFDTSYTKKNGASKKLKIDNESYDTNKDVTDILQEYFDPTYCKPALIAFQGEMDVVNATPSERRENLKKIYDLNFTQEIDSLSNEVKNLEKEIQNLQNEISVIENKQYDLHKEKDLPFDHAELLSKEQKLKDLTFKISSVEKEIEKYNLLKKNLESLENDYNYFEDEYAKNWKKIEEVDKSIDNFKEGLNNINKSTLERYKKELSEIILTRIKPDYDTTKEESLRNDIATQKNELKNIVEKISLIEKGKCPTCGNDFSNVDIQEFLNKKIEIENKINSLNLLLEEEKNNYNKWKKEYDENENNKTRKNNLEKYIEMEENKIQSHISTFKERIVDKENLKNSLIEEREKLSAKIDKIYKEIQDFDMPDQYPEIDEEDKKLAIILEQEIKNYTDITSYNTWAVLENEKIQKSMIKDKEQIDKLKKEKIKKEKDLVNYSNAVTILKKDFPNYIINSLKEEIEFGMNDILDKAYNGKYHISIQEKRNGLVINYGNKKEIKLASGAEQNLFTIGFKNAFTKLAGLKVLLLDEVDNFMDENIAKQTFEVINSLIEQGLLNQVILISHKESVKTMLEADYKAKILEVSNGGVI